jgi:hypothetical protein
MYIRPAEVYIVRKPPAPATMRGSLAPAAAMVCALSSTPDAS